MNAARWLSLALSATLFALALPAQAHKASDSYLELSATDNTVSGRWDIALRDLEQAVGLDLDGDDRLSWGEVRQREQAITAYALAHLRLAGNAQACSLEAGPLQLSRHVDGIYAALPLRGRCAAGTDALQLGYSLMFALDRQHRGLARIENRGERQALVFAPEHMQQSVRGRGAWATLLDFVRQGVLHIATGYDHVLFLLSLLLPSVLVWRGGNWQAAPEFRGAFYDVLRVVTAFTVAHSVTLGLATTGLMQLPSRWVESAIALSVVLAAANNLRPFLRGRRWAVAFGFGLIHGFGFASVLAELGLPAGRNAVALGGFNLGVELGQLALVAAFLPLAYGLRARPLYRHAVLAGGSGLIVLLAGCWLVERAFEVRLW